MVDSSGRALILRDIVGVANCAVCIPGCVFHGGSGVVVVSFGRLLALNAALCAGHKAGLRVI